MGCLYDIISVPGMTDVVQVRTHKKKRINKKWRKYYGFKKVPSKVCYIIDNKIYCHPNMIEKIKADIEKHNRVSQIEAELKEQYNYFIITAEGKKWRESWAGRLPDNENVGFGEYLYDFYPEILS